MENFLIGTRETSATSPQTQRGAQRGSKATSSSGGFQASFNELMQKVGSNTAKGLNAVVDNSAIGSVIGKDKGRSDQAFNRSEQDYGSSREQDYERQADAVGRGDIRGDNRPAERRDSQGRDNISERGNSAENEGRAPRIGPDNSNRDAVPEDLSKASGDASTKPEQTTKASGDGSAKPDQTTNDKSDTEGHAKGQESADKNEISSKKVHKSSGEKAIVVNPVVISNIIVAANTTDKILTSPKKSPQANRSSEDDKGNVAEQILGQDISKTKSKVKGKTETKDSAAKASNNVATDVRAKPGGKAVASAKVGNSALNDQAKPGDDADSDIKSRLAQQAAGISKAVGKGAKIEVSVNVAKESDTLVSKPPLTLISQLSIGNKNDKQSGNGKSSQSASKNTVNRGLQQIKGSTAQSLDQPTKSQASKFQAEVGNRGKGPGQSTAQAGTTSQPTIPGGGETPSIAGPGRVAEPGQTQQSAAVKTAETGPTNLARQPVVDQVSVQITKAIAAGADKINIQLRPASLGRIEVHLEIAKSGHVSAVVIADNKNTLDMLQNGSDELKQALQNAGLATDSGSLNFGLREESHMADGGNGGAGSSAANRGSAGGEDDNAEIGPLISRDLNIITDNKVDVRA